MFAALLKGSLTVEAGEAAELPMDQGEEEENEGHDVVKEDDSVETRDRLGLEVQPEEVGDNVHYEHIRDLRTQSARWKGMQWLWTAKLQGDPPVPGHRTMPHAELYHIFCNHAPGWKCRQALLNFARLFWRL